MRGLGILGAVIILKGCFMGSSQKGSMKATVRVLGALEVEVHASTWRIMGLSKYGYKYPNWG